MKTAKALDVITQIMTAIENQPRTKQGLMEEIQQMRFKVTPISGDISHMKWEYGRFLESLWSLGKIDEIVRYHFSKLDEEERARLFDFLSQYEDRFSEEIRDDAPSNPASEIFESSSPEILQLEIVREFDPASRRRAN